MYRKYFKRFIDIFLALLGLIILCPLLLILAVAVKVDSKGPILFKQKRVGLCKKYFNILKFRTMRINTPDNIPTHMLTNPEVFITQTGRVLRKTSLDELPQIWNILTGQMTFVGPRPALWNQEDLIAERDKYGANDIKPGLTGWAQIHGRDELKIVEKAKLDGEYVQKISFMLDLKCIILTVFRVLKQEGIVEGRIKGA